LSRVAAANHIATSADTARWKSIATVAFARVFCSTVYIAGLRTGCGTEIQRIAIEGRTEGVGSHVDGVIVAAKILECWVSSLSAWRRRQNDWSTGIQGDFGSTTTWLLGIATTSARAVGIAALDKGLWQGVRASALASVLDTTVGQALSCTGSDTELQCHLVGREDEWQPVSILDPTALVGVVANRLWRTTTARGTERIGHCGVGVIVVIASDINID
jgi:hypothetical protein